MAVHDLETMARLRELQIRVQNNDPVTKEEYRELILWLQEGRAVRAARGKSRAKAGTPAPMSLSAMTDLLNQEQKGLE
jgi:hypothetical protein